MTIEEMKRKKTELGLTNEMIAKAADIPLSTIQKVMGKVTKAPRRATLEAIEAVLYAEEQRRKTPGSGTLPEKPAKTYAQVYEQMDREDSSLCKVADSAFEYNATSSARDMSYEQKQEKPIETKKKDGEYTIEDYYALPDERRVELIDGVFYDMAAPAVIHQKILGELHILFRECVDAHDGTCEVLFAPCDVRLDCDNRTMVQPDILMICKDYDIKAKALDGAPDFTLEILSPSTRAKDMLLKLYKYQNAGVREYWVVDPEKEEVLVYDLEHGGYTPEKFDFDAVIPIHISNGECAIDFSRVSRALKRVRGV